MKTEALQRLGALPGMHAVKEQVEQIIQFHRISKTRASQGLKTHHQSVHMVFTGNPGTGKTTAARLIGEAFAALNILKSNRREVPFVEIHHADITHPHVGQAERTIKDKFKEARGGVIFIDEAYAFVAGETSHNSGDKVIAAIVQLMEDMREEIIVIAAGYPKEMEEFLNENPGLRSRFPSTVHFPDYDIPDLIKIALTMCSDREYQPSQEFIDRLIICLKHEKLQPNFGNGRTVRNLIEQAIRVQSSRVAQIQNPTREDLIWLIDADIRYQPKPLASEKDKLQKVLQKIQGKLLEIELLEITSKSS